MAESREVLSGKQVTAAVLRVCDALDAHHEEILSLDQAMGDGDLGITVAKIAAADRKYAQETPVEDIGKYLFALGMETNKAAPSTMGTLLATALMRAGKEVRGAEQLTLDQLVKMISVAEQGMQERGKAKLGDKTVLDALHPAVAEFSRAVEAGLGLKEAGEALLAAAEKGRDSVTNRQSRIGRASWVGERTIGLVDPGCAVLVVIFKALVDK